MADVPALLFLKGLVYLEDVLDDDDDMLAQLQYPQHKKEFFDYLMVHKAENLVRSYLGVSRCHICVMEIWKSGSFNVCVPILIPATGRRGHDKVFVRFPLPYKVGEANNPRNAEEKLRTEVAAYIWL